MSRSEGFIPAPGGRLYYERAGSGNPVVWLHAGFLDRRMWDPQVPRFASRYEVIRYDRRGFGRSDPPTAEYREADDLDQLLDGLGVASAYFVGLSEGGRIALDYATRRPERVDGLCVIGSGLSGYEPTDEREEAMWMDLARRDQEIGHLAGAGDTRRAIDALLDLWAPAIDRPTRQWARGIALENHAAALGRFDELQQPIDPPAIRRLEAIGAPVLALTGTKDFPAYERVADLLVSRLPNAQKEALEGADHLANLSRREAFDAQLEGFLARLDFLAMRRGSTR